jgi:hypothetical protein
VDYYQIQADLKSPTIRLLGSNHAPFILSFFHAQYKQTQRSQIPYQALIEALEFALDTARQIEPEGYTRAPREYLKDWIDHQYLREYTDVQLREKVVELTPHAERALRWLDDLRERQFIGTESRLLRIFALLEDIASRSTEDVTLRLQQLERQRQEIDAEIQKIRETGQAERLTGRQIREWFLEAEDTARQMISDFREVEEKFRTTAREVYAAQLDPTLRRGDVLGGVIDADAALRESDQGRSFYAFYEFLGTQDRKEQFQEMVRQVYMLPDLTGIARPELTLRRFIWNMVDAAQKVRDQNNRLIEQLRRLLDSRALQESRRVRELIDHVKRAAIQRSENPPLERDFFHIGEDKTLVQLPMDREFWKPAEPLQITPQALVIGEASDFDALETLRNAFYIDEGVLRNQIETLLDFSDSATLQQVLAQYPLQKGIPELVAYLNIALTTPEHEIDMVSVEALQVQRHADHQDIIVHLPRVTFRRIHA